MDFFSNTQPDLIGNGAKKIYKLLSKNTTTDKTYESALGYLQYAYNTFVSPNLPLIILIFAVVIFLYYKYQCKNEKTSENFKDLDDPNERVARPTLNPLFPINAQKSYVHYLPDDIPFIDDDHYTTYNEEHPTQKSQYDAPPNFDTGIYNKGPFYSGTKNTFKNAEDPVTPNWLGFPTDFNTSTGYAVNNITKANRDNIIDLQNYNNGTQNDLTNILNSGSVIDEEMYAPYQEYM